jgi:hypothetical protein
MELDMASSDQDYGVAGDVNPDTPGQILLVFPDQSEEGKSRVGIVGRGYLFCHYSALR